MIPLSLAPLLGAAQVSAEGGDVGMHVLEYLRRALRLGELILGLGNLYHQASHLLGLQRRRDRGRGEHRALRTTARATKSAHPAPGHFGWCFPALHWRDRRGRRRVDMRA